MSAPTVAAAVALDEAAAARRWTSDDRDAVEARCAAWAQTNGREVFNVADVAFVLKTRAEALPRAAMGARRIAPDPDAPNGVRYEPDPEYADVDEAGQLALGMPGDQRSIPGLAAPPKKED